MIHERFVALVGEERLDDALEEVRVFACEEEVEFVAGVCGVEVRFAFRGERVPFEEP